MNWLISLLILVSAISSYASEISPNLTPTAEIERSRKRLYPGGRDEEDLKVLASLPEAARKTDTKSIQKEVYKNLFDQELKDDEGESSEPEAGH